jgi:hypothetical protein
MYREEQCSIFIYKAQNEMGRPNGQKTDVSKYVATSSLKIRPRLSPRATDENDEKYRSRQRVIEMLECPLHIPRPQIRAQTPPILPEVSVFFSVPSTNVVTLSLIRPQLSHKNSFQLSIH